MKPINTKFAIKVAVVAAVMVAIMSPSAADAKKRQRRHQAPAEVQTSFFGSAFGGSIVAVAKSQIGNGAIYGRRNLWCGRFMNWVLERSGHKGTGSDMASSFANVGTRIHGPQVGALAVMGRKGGGHVGVVTGIDPNGNPIVVSGNHNGRVEEHTYPKSRIRIYVAL